MHGMAELGVKWKCVRVDTQAQTLVVGAHQSQLPAIVYWGPPLPPHEDLAALAASLQLPVTQGTLDHIAPQSICPEEGRGYSGFPGIQLTGPDKGPVFTQFATVRLDQVDAGILWEAIDQVSGIRLDGQILNKAGSDVLQLSSVLTWPEDINDSARVEWLTAPALPLPQDACGMIDFAGRWTHEFTEMDVAFRRGAHIHESRRGRTGHDHFPGLLVTMPGASFATGGVYGMHLAWSGNHRLHVEELADGRRTAQLGALSGVGEWTAVPGGRVETPILYVSYSDRGRNGLAHAFQDHVRQHVVRFPRPSRPRPVHYNCWEAVYFNPNHQNLIELADRAARIGAERFVLDDGWFGLRDDDSKSLGDWVLDRRKFPDGLKPLIQHVADLGMTFGIWFEPEMVNLDSDLARAHPDWIIMPDGRKQMEGRQQHVLDLSKPEVVEYLFNALDAIFTEYDIDYVKWDMNRDVTLHALPFAQTKALYGLIDRLSAKHPMIEFESCASGGGRIDYGILERTQRVWLSDSNDAHERWRMQNSAMQFLPPEIVGSHVGPRHCHTSGRVLSAAFRAQVAMTAHMGFEMDLRELSETEEETLSYYTSLYKTHRDWMHRGLQYRLESGHDWRLAQCIVSEDRSKLLVFSATMANPLNETSSPLRLQGLDPNARYRLQIVNQKDVETNPTRYFDTPFATSDGLVLTGRALMQSGIVLPFSYPDSMWVVAGDRLDDDAA